MQAQVWPVWQVGFVRQPSIREGNSSVGEDAINDGDSSSNSSDGEDAV